MFANDIRINHIRQLYLYLLKYDDYMVYAIRQLGDSYAIELAVRDKTYGYIPIHKTLILSPVPEEE